MKNKSYLFKILLYLVILLSGSIIYAQDDCKVLIPELSGTYTGGCKKGLAHGKGLAMGIDSYEGRFTKGLPNGLGKYTWEDGTRYEGYWSKGVRDGKGTMTYPRAGEDSIVAGIWNDDEYMGKEIIPPYRITRTQGIVRSSIRKVNEVGSGFSLTLYLAGRFNTDIESFFIDADNGEEFVSGRKHGIENATAPYSVSIKYRVWNTMHSQQHEVFFDFTINEPGTFEVSITN